MLLNFPHPFPDELYYSWLARYKWARSLNNHSRAMRLITGRRVHNIAVILPTGLAAFASQLANSNFDPDRIMQQHTLLPVYAPFLPSNRLAKVEATMRGVGRPSAVSLNCLSEVAMSMPAPPGRGESSPR
jgi:hypothetical protein